MSRGNITLLSKSKNSWRVRVELPREEENSKRRQKGYTVYGTRKDAEKFLTEKLREIDTGVLVDNKKLKYSEYLDLWEDKTFINLEITTIEGYKSKIEKHIKPNLGNLYLENIKPLHLQNFYNRLLKKENNNSLSNRTVLSIHRIIHSSLKQAVRWQLVNRNVADCVEPPKAKKYNANYLSDKETEKLLIVAKDSDIYIPIAIAIYTGTRRGETLGLTWDNVNLEKGYIKIVNNLCATKNGLIMKQPKTNSGIRTIAISDTLIKILKKHKVEQMKYKMLLGGEYKDNGLVCTYKDGRAFNPKRFSAKFQELLEKNNLTKIRFHDLRHSHASLLVKMGVQPKEISARLGHSNIGITMDLYSHIYEETDREVANMFDKIIKINYP